jgi:NSS family neurotransmitter:Na+ symporter
VEAGFIAEAPGFLTVLATAGGQMFFSLSLAMGAMITYGSYLSKQENLVKNSGIIVVADTLVATMAGLAVIPAAVANGIANGVPYDQIKLGGPNLLFVTLQDVFHAMGAVGPLFGVIFYALVLIAAISSAISLVEVVATYFMDRAAEKGKAGNRPRIVLWVCLAVLVEASIVAIDGLGSNGVWVPFQNSLGVVGAFNDCWLDFMDCLSEGIAMPLGALLMSIMIGWEIKPKTLLDEIHIGCNAKIDAFFSFCIKFIAPLGMLLILAGQLNDFLGLGWF